MVGRENSEHLFSLWTSNSNSNSKMDPPLDAPLRLNNESRVSLNHQEAANELRYFISSHAARNLGHSQNIQADQNPRGTGLTGAALERLLRSLEEENSNKNNQNNGNGNR